MTHGSAHQPVPVHKRRGLSLPHVLHWQSSFLGRCTWVGAPTQVHQKIINRCSDPCGSLTTNSLPVRISASMYS